MINPVRFTLCEENQNHPDLGADWVRENGELVVGGTWLTDLGISKTNDIEIATNPGVIAVHLRE